MSSSSNNQGRAFEYAVILALESEIAKNRSVNVIKDNSFLSAERAWNLVSQTIQANLEKSAIAAVPAIFEMEPIILEEEGDILELRIQSDQCGKAGDVRDVLIIRSGIEWEIGLSIKHGHFAVKHSRLSNTIDFGEKWFGVKCSDRYWKDVTPVFTILANEKKRGLNGVVCLQNTKQFTCLCSMHL